jgi:hypothetical protein
MSLMSNKLNEHPSGLVNNSLNCALHVLYVFVVTMYICAVHKTEILKLDKRWFSFILRLVCNAGTD